MSVVALLKTVLSLFTDCSFTVNRWMKDRGWRRRQLRMRTWTGTFMWKKDKYEANLHQPINLYKRWQEWSIYPIFTTVFWWLSLIPGSVFRLKKDTEENSEDSSEGDPEENTAGEQPWWGTKR